MSTLDLNHRDFVPRVAPRFSFRAATLASLWVTYLAARPHRLVPSGLPQPADILLVLVFTIALATLGWVSVRASRVTLALGLLVTLVVYAATVNAIWSIVFGDLRRNHLETLYFIYNAMACLTVAMLYQQYGVRFARWTLVGVYVSLSLEVIVSLAGIGGGADASRGVGSFHNPNQLGYYALLSASLIYLCTRIIPRANRFTATSFCFLVVASGLVAESRSRAAIVAIGALWVIYLLMSRVTWSTPLTLGVFAGMSLLFWSLFALQERFMEDERLQGVTNELGVRGYDRIVKNPVFLLMGAGEGGGPEQFEAEHYGELHSSLGTLAFCYGIPGLLLFSSLILIAFRTAPIVLSVAILPSLLYSFTHNGLRQTEFWILLMLIICAGVQNRRPTAVLMGRRVT